MVYLPAERRDAWIPGIDTPAPASAPDDLEDPNCSRQVRNDSSARDLHFYGGELVRHYRHQVCAEFEIRIAKDRQHCCLGSPLRKPVVPSMGEVAKIRQLDWH